MDAPNISFHIYRDLVAFVFGMYTIDGPDSPVTWLSVIAIVVCKLGPFY